MREEYGIYLFIFLAYIFTSYPRNMHQNKIFDSQKTHEKKPWTHEITTRRNFVTTKYPREKISDPQNIHENKIRTLEGTMTRWNETHKTHDSTKPTEFSTLLYLPQVKRALTLSITNIRYKLPHKLPNLNLEFKTAWSK